MELKKGVFFLSFLLLMNICVYIDVCVCVYFYVLGGIRWFSLIMSTRMLMLIHWGLLCRWGKARKAHHSFTCSLRNPFDNSLRRDKRKGIAHHMLDLRDKEGDMLLWQKIC